MNRRRRVEITAIRRTAMFLCNRRKTGLSGEAANELASDETGVAVMQPGNLFPAGAACSSEPAILIDVLVKSDEVTGPRGEEFVPSQSGNYTKLLSLGISIRSSEGGE
ncbi:MAG TPA: hypothetical protein VGV87_08720 [Blastocatellia bacterium]|nr:hypothetical protein [Blastocatellia bacterium]